MVYYLNENSQITETLRYCSEQTIFLYFWKIHYNINKIYYVSIYFNLILYKLIDYNDLNVLFSSEVLKTKKHQLSTYAYILLIEHAQCKQHVTFIHKIVLLLQTFRARAKSVPEDSFFFIFVKYFFDRQCLERIHMLSQSSY